MGYLLACVSILLVSVAQLAMKYALTGLPPIWSLHQWWHSDLSLWLWLGCGLLCYLLSMMVWYFTLRCLALGKAYALLSLSYVVVWGGALLLPVYQEMFSLRALSGVLAIVGGVLLVCWPRTSS